MRKCAICNSTIQTNFSVPQDEKQRDRWSKRCGVVLNPKARVCIDHFPASCIINMGKRKQLMPYAEPIETGKHLQQLLDQQSINNRKQQQSLADKRNLLQKLSNNETSTTSQRQECYEDSQTSKDPLTENVDQPVEFKCGEIFCINFSDLRITCDFCNTKPFGFNDFLIHLHNVHFQYNELKPQQPLDCIKIENFDSQNEEEEEHAVGWLENFEKIHTLVEKNDDHYVTEDTEIVEDGQQVEDKSKVEAVDGKDVGSNEHDKERVEEEKNKKDLVVVKIGPCNFEEEEDIKNKDSDIESIEDNDEIDEQTTDKKKKYVDEDDVIGKDVDCNEDDEENAQEEEEKVGMECNSKTDLRIQDFDIESVEDNDDMDEFLTSPSKDDDAFKDKTVKKKRTLKKVLLEFQCPECPQQFTLKKLLDNHVFENHGGYKCSKCDKRCRMRRHLVRHEERHNFREYSCTVSGCNKVFADLDYCKRHIEEHNTGLKFVCSYENCGKGFLTSMRLKLHNKLHTRGCRNRYVKGKILNYVCEMCGYSCHASTSLEVHQRLHTGEKPFSCETCGKRYISQYSLKKHIVSHSDERRYKCEICQATFKSNDVLSRHKHLHSNERKFKCNYCGKAFKQPHCRNAHIKQVHKGIKHVRAKRKRKQKDENAKTDTEISKVES